MVAGDGGAVAPVAARASCSRKSETSAGRGVERATAPAPRGSARTAADRCGRPRACCARARARTRDRRGSRARGARRGARRWAARWWPRRRISPAPRRIPRGATPLGQRLRNARSQSRPTSVFASRLSRIALSSCASGHSTLDPLVLVRLGGLVVEIGGHEEVALLVGESRRGVEAREVLPGARALADLLGELALAVSSGFSPSSSSLPAGSSRSASSPTASRGWRTRYTISPSWATSRPRRCARRSRARPPRRRRSGSGPPARG